MDIAERFKQQVERSNASLEIASLAARIADLEFAAREMLSTFTEAGHPGEPCVRSQWINLETHLNWCRLVNPAQESEHYERGTDMTGCDI